MEKSNISLLLFHQDSNRWEACYRNTRRKAGLHPGHNTNLSQVTKHTHTHTQSSKYPIHLQTCFWEVKGTRRSWGEHAKLCTLEVWFEINIIYLIVFIVFKYKKKKSHVSRNFHTQSDSIIDKFIILRLNVYTTQDCTLHDRVTLRTLSYCFFLCFVFFSLLEHAPILTRVSKALPPDPMVIQLELAC